jgi:hypothetical protein
MGPALSDCIWKTRAEQMEELDVSLTRTDTTLDTMGLPVIWSGHFRSAPSCDLIALH